MKFKILLVLIAFVLCVGFNFNNTGVSAEASGKNLCLDGVTVTWSGTWVEVGSAGTNNPGTNLIDGDYANKWGSYNIRVSGEEWVQITFNKTVDIGGFYIVQEPSGSYTNIGQYKIQIQNGSDTWVDAYTSVVFDSFWTEDSSYFTTPIKATAFRFIVKSDQALDAPLSPAGECAIELSEIEIYEGVAAASTTNAGTSATMATGATSVPGATTTNASAAKASATQSKVNATTVPNAKASSTPSVDDKGTNSAFVPILIGSVIVVAAGATAAIMIIKKRKS